MENKTTENQAEKTGRSSLTDFLMIGIVALTCSAAGFGLSHFLAKSSGKPAEDNVADAPVETPDKPTERTNQKNWFYDLEPVVANLNVPGATRFVRATLTLEINSKLDEEKGRELINYKTPILKNWLTMYLASLSLDDVRGDRNLRRIQSQTLQAFNEELFGDSEPLVINVLFKEFPIQ